MSIAGIKVLVIGKAFGLPHEVLAVQDPKQVMSSIASFRPDVIVSSGALSGALMGAAFEIRKRWIHVPENSKDAEVVAAVESCYAFNLWTEHPNQKENPLISIYMATRNTGDILRDTYQSFRDQTYTNWELVCVDDASEDGTWDRLVQLASEDYRVRPFRNARRSGKIGEVKDAATKLCRGEIFVENDHDDMLTSNALEEIKKAFDSDPEIGFVYSNHASFYEDGSPQRFNDAFWKDRYKPFMYRGKEYLECNQPNLLDRFGPHYTEQFAWYLTVGVHHVKAFRASFFREIGGYNHLLSVCDDFDLQCRAFLASDPAQTVEK